MKNRFMLNVIYFKRVCVNEDLLFISRFLQPQFPLHFASDTLEFIYQCWWLQSCNWHDAVLSFIPTLFFFCFPKPQPRLYVVVYPKGVQLRWVFGERKWCSNNYHLESKFDVTPAQKVV